MYGIDAEAEGHRNAERDGAERPERPRRRHGAGHDRAPQAFGPQREQPVEILGVVGLVFGERRFADMARGEPREHHERGARHNSVPTFDAAFTQRPFSVWALGVGRWELNWDNR